MDFQPAYKSIAISFVTLSAIVMLFLGLAFGKLMAANHNLRILDDFGEEKLAIPTRILDNDGNLITEFFSDEKRDLITIKDIPENLIYALMTREDKTFFQHNGFSFRGVFRAVFNIMTGRYFSGGSTLTQQVAGQLFEDRKDISVLRKLKEMWWAYQLERVYSKYEILESYMNKMPFGHGAYGVEAASQFFFGHPAKTNTISESVLLVIQLAKPGLYSPIRNPDRAKTMQKTILAQAVREGYVTKEEAETSFDQYWNNYDWTITTSDTIYWARDDKAPFFSEYIRELLEEMLLGSMDIYRDGYTVHTTLNLDHQQKADKIVKEGLVYWNKTYSQTVERQLVDVNRNFISIIDLLSLTFNLPDLRVRSAKTKRAAKQMFESDITPLMGLLSLTFNIEDLNYLATTSFNRTRKAKQQTTVETSLVTIENETGYITAMIGGSEFSRTNQFNRAVRGNMQPGSAFKPLYYSAAISSRKFTPASHLSDSWEVFYNPDGTEYAPQNYRGEWRGDVLLRTALALSLNVPSLKILQGIGFDAAIDRSAKLLGIEDESEKARVFPRVFPLGLGIISVSPLQMARAFATFGNNGRLVTPIAIRYIEDRSGNIILSPEEDVRDEQKRQDIQIMTPQENYIMVSLMKSVVEEGTLSYSTVTDRGRKLPMPMAGKTGTTQNWSDAWACGYSPYYTTVMWIGFDQRGASLGTGLSGAAAVGPYWARYMIAIHDGLPKRDFIRPETGLVEVGVCAQSGQIPTEYCNEGIRREIFLAGTQPNKYCEFHQFEQETMNYIKSTKIKTMHDPVLDQGQTTGQNGGLMEGFDIDLDYLYEEDHNEYDTLENSGDSSNASDDDSIDAGLLD
jgi:penicillin-binding protein 1A